MARREKSFRWLLPGRPSNESVACCISASQRSRASSIQTCPPNRACGRPRKHSRADDKTLVQHAKRVRTEPSRLTAHWMRLHRGRPLSSSTIRRILLGAGLWSSWIVKRPALKEAQKERRLRYALDNRTRDWNLAFICDQTSFYACARKHRTVHEEFVPVPTVKHPPEINAWASISARGKGKLFVFKENLDAALISASQTTCCPRCVRRTAGAAASWWCSRTTIPSTMPKCVWLPWIVLPSLACSSRP